MIRSVAHARQSAPLFGQLSQIEIKKLRQLPPWVRWLYFELVCLSNFDTGRLYVGSDPKVSYAKLAALLAHDANPHDPKPAAAPSHDQIRRALAQLVSMGLVGRNEQANEGARALFLEVARRKDSVSASVNRARDFARPQEHKKTKKNKDLEAKAGRTSPETAPGVPEGIFNNSPKPHDAPQLSTGEGPRPPEPADPPGAITLARGDQKFVPPRGHESCPPQGGHAPRVTPTTAGMQARLKGSSAPPGGQADAPQGDALPPSARIRRPKVLKGEGAQSATASPAPDAGTDAAERP